MTGRNFEKEYNVILNSKEFNEKNFENYKIQINKDVKEFVKKNLNHALFFPLHLKNQYQKASPNQIRPLHPV